jgi:hypothetical protein
VENSIRHTSGLLLATSDYRVVEYYYGVQFKSYRFETRDECVDYIDRQGNEPGVEYTIVEG